MGVPVNPIQNAYGAPLVDDGHHDILLLHSVILGDRRCAVMEGFCKNGYLSGSRLRKEGKDGLFLHL